MMSSIPLKIGKIEIKSGSLIMNFFSGPVSNIRMRIIVKRMKEKPTKNPK